MKSLTLINTQQETVGQIHWESPDYIEVDISDPSLLAEINHLITDTSDQGLLLRSGELLKNEDEQQVFVERLDHVKSNDERFLDALADTLATKKIAGQRIFGLVK